MLPFFKINKKNTKQEENFHKHGEALDEIVKNFLSLSGEISFAVYDRVNHLHVL